MNERLKLIRKNLNFSQEEVGNRLGVNKATISRLEKGINNLTEQMIKSICREFNINEKWFRTGEGEMNKFSDQEDRLSTALAEISLSDNEQIKSIVENLIKLDDKYIDLIDKLIDGLINENKQ